MLRLFSFCVNAFIHRYRYHCVCVYAIAHIRFLVPVRVALTMVCVTLLGINHCSFFSVNSDSVLCFEDLTSGDKAFDQADGC